MPFSDLLAQEPAVSTLERALASGRVHHAYRFEGPPGVGKEIAALSLAQALVCERGEGRACLACGACRRAVTFTDELLQVCRRIAAMPRSFRRRDDIAPGVRAAVHGRYLVLFRLPAEEGSTVRVERIVHGARRLRGLL